MPDLLSATPCRVFVRIVGLDDTWVLRALAIPSEWAEGQGRLHSIALDFTGRACASENRTVSPTRRASQPPRERQTAIAATKTR